MTLHSCNICGKGLRSESAVVRHRSHTPCGRIWRAEQKRLCKSRTSLANSNDYDSSHSTHADGSGDWFEDPGHQDGGILASGSREDTSDPGCLRGDSPTAQVDSTVVESFSEPTILGHAKTKFEILLQKRKLEAFRMKEKFNPLSPFTNRQEWELVKFIFSSGLTRDEMEEMVKLETISPEIREELRSFYMYRKRLNSLPEVPLWTCRTITVQGTCASATSGKENETLEWWSRNPLQLIQELLENPHFKDDLCYTPKKLYTDSSESKERIYNEMWTGDWWWNVAEKIPKGAIIIPVILASDKTQLTQFKGDKTAWPVYLTIGNLPSAIRRQVSKNALKLLAYLPINKLDNFNKGEQSLEGYRLFHICMRILLQPLIHACKHGVQMRRADGVICLVYPILASYIADYPEQCLIACCKESRCPVCRVERLDRGDNLSNVQFRTMTRTLKALNDNYKIPNSSVVFDDDGLRSVYPPFWAGFPHSDIFQCFTPDLLHQIHKGVFKDHVYKWCVDIAGADLIDARFRSLPNHPSLRQFDRGITHIKQWTGTEAKDVEKVFVGVIAGAIPNRALKAARALIDFIFLASYHSHTTDTLRRLQEALDEFHEHKDVFIELSQRDDFNFPKIHMLQHYVHFIKLLGTTDGYNTEMSERGHIKLAKDLYRQTNKKNYYKQMAEGLTRKEQMQFFECFLQWLAESKQEYAELINRPIKAEAEVTIAGKRRISRRKRFKLAYSTSIRFKLPKSPSWMFVKLETLVRKHGAVDFMECLTRYITEHDPLTPTLPHPTDAYHVFKCATIHLEPLNGFETQVREDIIRATPSESSKNPSYFDTVLIHENELASVVGVEGYRVVQIRAIFILSDRYKNTRFYQKPLAYVEFFTPFGSQRQGVDMYAVRRSIKNSKREAAIIALDSIRCSCHLIPIFGSDSEFDWTSDNVLEKCESFYVNSYLDTDTFQMFIG